MKHWRGFEGERGIKSGVRHFLGQKWKNDGEERGLTWLGAVRVRCSATRLRGPGPWRGEGLDVLAADVVKLGNESMLCWNL